MPVSSSSEEETLRKGVRVRTSVHDGRKYVDSNERINIRHAPAVSQPNKIVCVGANYRKHALEAGLPVLDQPIYLAKFGDNLAGHREDVVLPAATAKGD